MTDLLFKCFDAMTDTVASENGWMHSVRARDIQCFVIHRVHGYLDQILQQGQGACLVANSCLSG